MWFFVVLVVLVVLCGSGVVSGLSWLTFRTCRLQRDKQPVRRRLQSAIVVLGRDWLRANILIRVLIGPSAGPDLDLEDSSSAATAGGSDDQRESTDSASFSIPSLELSDGLTAAGSSLDVEDGLSSSYSAPGVEAPSLKDDETLEAAGETSPRGLCVHMNTVCLCVCVMESSSRPQGAPWLQLLLLLPPPQLLLLRPGRPCRRITW